MLMFGNTAATWARWSETRSPIWYVPGGSDDSLDVASNTGVAPSALTKFNGLVRSHMNVSGSPSGSMELDALRIIGLPTQKLYGPPALAIGGRLPSITVTGQLAEAVKPFWSVTVSTTLNVPSCANV